MAVGGGAPIREGDREHFSDFFHRSRLGSRSKKKKSVKKTCFFMPDRSIVYQFLSDTFGVCQIAHRFLSKTRVFSSTVWTGF